MLHLCEAGLCTSVAVELRSRTVVSFERFVRLPEATLPRVLEQRHETLPGSVSIAQKPPADVCPGSSVHCRDLHGFGKTELIGVPVEGFHLRGCGP